MEKIEKRSLRFPSLASFDMQLNYVEITRDEPSNQFDSHVHPQCELYINLTGDVSFMVEKRIYPILPGSVILTRPYEYHHCIYHGDALHRHFWILFSVEGNEALLDRFFRREVGEGNLLLLSIEAQKELVALCQEMIHREGSSAQQLYWFLRLIRLLDGAEVSDGGVTSYPEDIAEALEYINCHFAEPISVRELAARAHVSVNTLERHFGQALQMSPTAYLKKKRLAHAAQELYRGCSVLEACLNSGFSDYCNFIALFKKCYGMTPLQYQKHVAR